MTNATYADNGSTDHGLPDYDELPEIEGLGVRHAWDVFGRDDVLGSINLITPSRVARAASSVSTGQMISLGALPRAVTWRAFSPAGAVLLCSLFVSFVCFVVESSVACVAVVLRQQGTGSQKRFWKTRRKKMFPRLPKVGPLKVCM